MDFLKDNWIAIFSLIIALIGGVPGIITIINQQKNRPNFEFTLVNFITGQLAMQKHKDDPAMILLTGTASNKGNTVLTPAHFEFKAKIDGRWHNFEKTLIPENAVFDSEAQNIKINNPYKNDLQRFNGSITTGMPLYGHLMFISHKIPLRKLRDTSAIEMRLICLDIFGKRHETELKHGGNAIQEETIYPKHGINVKPKT